MSGPSRRRELFEALYRARYLRIHARLYGPFERDRHGEYTSSGLQIAWELWQVAYDRALELAAQHCERREAAPISQDGKALCRLCAREIRALSFAAGNDEV